MEKRAPLDYDPYADAPASWSKNSQRVVPAAVFLLTVALTVITFPPWKKSEGFAYFCLVPGIYWAYLRPNFKVYALTLLAAQAVAWTILLSWLHPVTIAGLFVLGPIVGVWVGLWYLAAWWTMPQMIGRPAPIRLAAMLGLAAVWVVIEWTRTWFLGGFPWLPLAASQWQQPSILQVAAYTGAYGISFVLVCMNLGLAAFSHRLFREGEQGLRRRSQEFLLALFFLFMCLTVHIQDTFNRRLYTVPFANVAFVQPDIPQSVKWDPKEGPGILSVLTDTTLKAADTRPDLILWPEAATPWAVKGDPEMRQYMEQLSARARSPILLGSIAIEGVQPSARWYNAAFVVDPSSGLQSDFYAKRRLVQFGEYIPLRPVLGWLTKFVPIGDDFSPGTDPAPLTVHLKGGSEALGVLICYEDAFPELARESVRSGADVLAVVTNDAWYAEGAEAYQHAAHSVLRAVETRRPVLRCGNAGWSGWIDEFGTIRKVITDEDGSVYFRGTQTLAITRDSRWIGKSSFYVEHGDWFVSLCSMLMLGGYALLRLNPPKSP